MPVHIHDRIEQEIEPSTVDRELDLIAQVINWATSVEEVHLHQSPMVGVRLPRYFDERDRRLRGDEEARLFAAAREEDRINSPQWAIEARVESARAHAALLSPSRQKRHLAAARHSASSGQSRSRVSVAIQFTSQVLPPSSENDCSK
jgi:hypothetical protein